MKDKTKKILRRVGIGLGAFFAVVLVLLITVPGPIIKGAAENLGPVFLGTPITIEKSSVNIFTGRIEFGGVVVGPPEGYDANVFEMKTFLVDVDMGSVFRFSEPIVVNEITIDKPIVSYELKGIHDNLHKLLDNLGANGEKTKEEKPDEEKSSGGRKVIIDHFLFADADVRVAVMGGKGVVVPLPKIELNDVGRKSGGATGLEVAGELIGDIVVGTVKVAAGVIGDVGGAVVDGAAAVGGAALDGAAAVGGAALDGAKAIGGAIGSLFGGSDDKAE